MAYCDKVGIEYLCTPFCPAAVDILENMGVKAFKTGSLMTLTALAAVLPAFFIVTGLPDSFRQIFLILAIGLFADLVNTWLTNASIIKWYCTKKGIQ